MDFIKLTGYAIKDREKWFGRVKLLTDYITTHYFNIELFINSEEFLGKFSYIFFDFLFVHDRNSKKV